jgi:hypothetical protein
LNAEAKKAALQSIHADFVLIPLYFTILFSLSCFLGHALRYYKFSVIISLIAALFAIIAAVSDVGENFKIIEAVSKGGADPIGWFGWGKWISFLIAVCLNAILLFQMVRRDRNGIFFGLIAFTLIVTFFVCAIGLINFCLGHNYERLTKVAFASFGLGIILTIFSQLVLPDSFLWTKVPIPLISKDPDLKKLQRYLLLCYSNVIQYEYAKFRNSAVIFHQRAIKNYFADHPEKLYEPWIEDDGSKLKPSEKKKGKYREKKQ